MSDCAVIDISVQKITIDISVNSVNMIELFNLIYEEIENNGRQESNN